MKQAAAPPGSPAAATTTSFSPPLLSLTHGPHPRPSLSPPLPFLPRAPLGAQRASHRAQRRAQEPPATEARA
jgi:hypothetical protein